MEKDQIEKEEKVTCKVGPMKTGLPWKDCATHSKTLLHQIQGKEEKSL